MVLGRLVFGMGGETLFVVQAVYAVDWFKNMEISLAMGIVSSIPNFVSFLSGLIIPWVYIQYDMFSALGLGAFLCFCSFILGLCLVLLDIHCEGHD